MSPPSGNEYSTASVSIAMSGSDFTEGTVTRQSSHTAFCPAIGSTFLQDYTYTAGPLTLVWAYYYCFGSSYCGTSSTGEVLYKRCNPNVYCNQLLTDMVPKPNYALIPVAFINIGVTNFCLARKELAEPVDKCYSPDPRP